MRLSELVSGYPCEVLGDGDPPITGLAYHSARVEPGWLFVAIPGYRTRGERYLQEALKRGAGAVAVGHHQGGLGVPVVVVKNPRQFLGWAAHRFYGYPASGMKLIGVTGTNGKTTTAWLIRELLRAGGHKVGVLGTAGYFDGERWEDATLTTPEGLDLAILFDRMRRNQVEYCVLEVSSHSLTLDRVYGLKFGVAVFTNLSQDHLDFHGSMDGYGAAKLKLFESLSPDALAVYNSDDPFSQEILRRTQARTLSFGIGPGAEVRAEPLRLGPDGSRVRLWLKGRSSELSSRLIGRHNLYNLMAAAGVGIGLGLSEEAIRTGAEAMRGVPGRLEPISAPRGIRVYVDYAHTPAALRSLLESVRELAPGRVILVFGCGGERDRTKRPQMGRIGTELADWTVITSDNPRGEPPEQILSEIAAGAVGDRYERLVDRREAIRAGIERARPGDAVVIAGKGDEGYQIRGEQRIPFDDRRVAQEILDELHG